MWETPWTHRRRVLERIHSWRYPEALTSESYPDQKHNSILISLKQEIDHLMAATAKNEGSAIATGTLNEPPILEGSTDTNEMSAPGSPVSSLHAFLFWISIIILVVVVVWVVYYVATTWRATHGRRFGSGSWSTTSSDTGEQEVDGTPIIFVRAFMTATGQSANTPRATSYNAAKYPMQFSVDSANWCGYVATSANLSSGGVAGSCRFVSGTFQVPRLVTSPRPPTNNNVSIWVGMDGAYGSDPTVQQLGVDVYCDAQGGTHSYVWFEMYPNPAYQIVNFPAGLGDWIQCSVSASSSLQYQLSIRNVTRGVSFVVPTSYTTIPNNAPVARVPKRSCAEWIVEAPWSGGVLPLSPFQPIQWKNCVATFGTSIAQQTIGSWPNASYEMETSSNQPKAEASALGSDQQSFVVTWFHT